MKKICAFFSTYPVFTFRPSQPIIRADEEMPPYVYYIKRGYVRQFAYSDRGEEITLALYKAPSFLRVVLGHYAQLNHYTYEALTTAVVYQCPRNDFFQFVLSDQQLLVDLVSFVGVWSMNLVALVERLVEPSAYVRILMMLLHLGKLYGQKKESDVMLELPLTHKMLASMVGLSRETVSREVEKMAKQRYLGKAKRFFVLHDTDRLAKLVERMSESG